MRRSVIIGLLTASLGLVLFASCGTSKKTAEGNAMVTANIGQKFDASESQLYAEDAPKGVLRAFGEGVDIEYGYARRWAAAQARDELARILKTQVESGISMYRSVYAKGNTTREESKQVRDIDGKNEDLITQMCSSAVQGSKIVKSDQYIKNNGEYVSHVCVEIDMEAAISNLNFDYIEQLISDDEKMEIDCDRARFKKELLEGLERYKNRR